MEGQLEQEKANLKVKIPEIKNTLSMVKQLIKNSESGDSMTTRFSLADNVYVKATVEAAGTVCLWLGANVMVEYTYEEAVKLLTDNLSGAETKLGQIVEDLGFMRDNSECVVLWWATPRPGDCDAVRCSGRFDAPRPSSMLSCWQGVPACIQAGLQARGRPRAPQGAMPRRRPW